MRKDLGATPAVYPEPVLIIGTYDDDGTPNAMNAAWGGIHDTDQLFVCIDPGHRTAANLKRSRAFTVSVGVARQAVACDYVGIVSGSEVADKVERAGWHASKSGKVDAPLFDELPYALECELISYDDKTGCTVARIVNVSVDDSVLAPDGKVDVAKLRPITFDPVNQRYLELGAAVGEAFSIGSVLSK